MRGLRTTLEEKRKKLEAILSVYSTQCVTIESACKNVGVGVRTSTEWCSDNAEFAELYKIAQTEHDKLYKERLKEKGRNSLEKMIEGYTVTIRRKEGILVGDGPDGKKVMVQKVVETEEHIKPSVPAIIFSLTNVDSVNFTNRYRSGENTGSAEIAEDKNLEGLTLEQLFVLKHGRKPGKNELKVL